MECFSRSHGCVQVTGEGGAGYLYFDAGRVVHASTARQRGVPAALEILGWTHGTFQPSSRSWPTGGPTIDMTHERLLLEAAKRRDEAGRSNLVALPQEDDMRNPNIDDRTPVPGPPAPPVLSGRADTGTADFPVMVRLASSGVIVRNKGGTEELAEAAAYAHRLAQLTGELLGLEELVAIECVFHEGRYVLFTEGDGEVVLLKPRPDLNLQSLRERLGL
jgi:hypothetical protein